MLPYFNTSGPCFPDEHYMLPPERRLGAVMELVDEGRYFTLHAGRQTGKTTSAQWLCDHYNAGDRFRALWVDVQTARDQPDPTVAFRTLLNNFDEAVQRSFPDLAPPADRARLLDDPQTAVRKYLSDLASRFERPLVVFFDEADCLVGATMVSFLTQLRAGYLGRRRSPFPHNVVLVGLREVRDYVLTQEDRRAVTWLGTTSPFNVSAEALTLAAFTEAEVVELLAQHTAATGQPFEPEAAARIFDLSRGHPWLVNALADQIVRHDVRDRTVPVTAAHVGAAKETLVVERRTHVDSLIAKLREPRVRRVLDPMLAGEQLTGDTLDDDVAYLRGLGLIRVVRGEYVVSNPIYREVIPRALTDVQQHSIHQPTEWYVRPDGTLDMPKIMAAWQTFWRQDGHLAAEGFGYRESGPHLMLMAFLQRIVNGGGRIEREYGLGRGALDLCVEWRGARHAVEMKLRRRAGTEKDAIAQVARYLDTLGLDEGWLVIFDLRSKLPWSKRLTTRTRKAGKKRVHVIGC